MPWVNKASVNKKTAIIVISAALFCAVIAFIVFFASRVDDIKLNSDTAELITGGTFSIEAEVSPAFAYNKALAYSSDNEDVAMVDSAGVVTAFAPGNAVINVLAEDGSGKSAALWVRVRQSGGDEIKLLTENAEMLIGETLQIAYRVTPQDGEVVWSCNNPAIAEVSKTGLVSAYHAGEATIRAESGGTTDEVVVKITERKAAASAKAESAGNGDNSSIVLAGSLMCTYEQRMAAANEDDFNFTAMLAQVSGILSDADYAIGQLDTPAARSFPYASSAPSVGAPLFNAPQSYLDALAASGIDGIAAASGHSCDMGAQGIAETAEGLKDAKLQYTGIFTAEDQPRFLLADAGGIKLGVLSYSEFWNGREALLSAAERAYMVNPLSPERVAADAKAAREAGAEFIIAYVSWNADGPQVNEAQRKMAQAIADAGVDVIAGTHPYMPQQAEYIERENGGSTLCAYSLGSLLTSAQSADSIILRLELERGDDGVFVKTANYTPCFVFSEYEGAGYVALPIKDGGSQAAARIAQAVGTQLASDVRQGGEDGVEQWSNGSYLIQED